jgi:thermolysin
VAFETLDALVERDPNLRFRTDADLGVVRHLRGDLARTNGEVERAGVDFVAEHRDLFGEIDPAAMEVLDTGRDDSGLHVTFQQRHADRYRVVNGSVRFHVTADGVLDTVSNRLFPDLAEVPAEPRVSAAEAVDVLRKHAETRAEPLTDPECVVIRHEGRPYLAWEVRLDTDEEQRGDLGEPTQWVGYVDATTGELLFRFNNIQTAGPVVANGTGYYSPAGPVNAWFTDTTYQLRDTTRTAGGGPEIRTDDEDGSSPSEDADGDWNTVTTSPRDSNQGAEVDAHRFTAAVVDYYRTVHGRVSFDGAGGLHQNVVHLGTDYSNGYWDGTKVNLGDGTGSAASGDDYECSDDWLGHEWTHAYTQYTCGLTYLNESGALNESFSDVMAAFITGDWLVFEDTWLKASAPAWRNMIDPTNGGQWDPAHGINDVFLGHQPSHYTVRYTGGSDNGGVHVNSGIINNLFYLLTVGGTHTVSGIVVSGVGQSVAERLLWRCMTVNLVGQPNATFLDFREAMVDAALDLFPGNLFVLAQVKAAFNAVGVGPDLYVRDNVADTGTEPYGGGYLWASPDIINRTAPEADPATAFADLTNDSLWQNVEFGQDNTVYVRLQNRGPEAGDATVNVYFSSASAFGTPASWIHVGAIAAPSIPSGAMRVVGPLTFPAALIPAPGHFCMIAVVSSSLDPAPDTSLIHTVNDYLDFVRGTNNIAYRNMDVVDAVPGHPGVVDIMVRTLGDDAHGWTLKIDDSRFVPGARVVVRGPAKVLDAAAAHGLKLVGREKEDAIYEVLGDRSRKRSFAFHGRDVLRKPPVPAFDRVFIAEDFVLRVEYELPERIERPVLRGHESRAPELVVRQSWRGRPVGAAGVRLGRAKRKG